MRQAAFPGRRGVTLTELLVVLVIISILALIAVPVYTNHAAMARKATAQAECTSLAQAEEACAAIHGFYVPLQLLNDLPGKAGVGNLSADADAIGNENSVFLIDTDQDILNLAQLSIGNTTNPKVLNLLNNWGGPFVNYQKFFIGTAASSDPQDIFGNLNRQDYPLDPWGNPYRFYSPRGIVGSQAASNDPNVWASISFSDGLINEAEDRFDRYAVVSFGPDGVANNRSNPRNVDDVIYYFGKVTIVNNETGFLPTNTPIPTPTPTPAP